MEEQTANIANPILGRRPRGRPPGVAVCKICGENHYTATHIRRSNALANVVNGTHDTPAHAPAAIPPALPRNVDLLGEESEEDSEENEDEDIPNQEDIPALMDDIDLDENDDDSVGIDEEDDIENNWRMEGVDPAAWAAVNGLAYDGPQNVVEGPFAEHHQQIPDFNGSDIQGPNYVNIKRTVTSNFHAQHSNEQRGFRWKPESFSALDSFMLFFSFTVMTTFVAATNSFGQRHFRTKWKDVTVPEFKGSSSINYRFLCH